MKSMQLTVTVVGKRSQCGSYPRDGLDAGWRGQIGSECVLWWLKQYKNFLVMKLSENFPLGAA